MFLWESIAFGPIHSRRLGNSLGINLQPTTEKICSFNCVYCECGWTPEKEIDTSLCYDLDTILQAIEKKLKICQQENIPVDSITFSGNGEPTLHPDFSKIIDNLLVLRKKYYPQSVITCLSNSTQLNKQDVREALQKIENSILKLDAGSEHLFQLIDRPVIPISLQDILGYLTSFKGNLIIQTLLLKGIIDNEPVDNSSGKELELLIGHIKQLSPKNVMLYSLDRETPGKNLIKISKEELEIVAQQIRASDITVSVY